MCVCVCVCVPGRVYAYVYRLLTCLTGYSKKTQNLPKTTWRYGPPRHGMRAAGGRTFTDKGLTWWRHVSLLQWHSAHVRLIIWANVFPTSSLKHLQTHTNTHTHGLVTCQLSSSKRRTVCVCGWGVSHVVCECMCVFGHQGQIPRTEQKCLSLCLNKLYILHLCSAPTSRNNTLNTAEKHSWPGQPGFRILPAA